MKVLFLDIDGVLNSEAYARTVHWLKVNNRGSFYSGFNGAVWDFCPVATALFSGMMSKLPDVKIVVSSCWRVGRTTADLQTLFTDRGLIGASVIDRTGASRDSRGEEIQEWLDNHPEVTRFVILDDDADMGSLANRLVQTSFRTGLTCDAVDKVIRAFG